MSRNGVWVWKIWNMDVLANMSNSVRCWGWWSGVMELCEGSMCLCQQILFLDRKNILATMNVHISMWFMCFRCCGDWHMCICDGWFCTVYVYCWWLMVFLFWCCASDGFWWHRWVGDERTALWWWYQVLKWRCGKVVESWVSCVWCVFYLFGWVLTTWYVHCGLGRMCGSDELVKSRVDVVISTTREMNWNQFKILISGL
jgi:hypothetical protein